MSDFFSNLEAKLARFRQLPIFSLLDAADASAYFTLSSLPAGFSVVQFASLSAGDLAALGLSKSDLEILDNKLNELCPIENVENVYTEEETLEIERLVASKNSAANQLSSVAQEQVLTSTLTELANSPILSIISSKILRDFWPVGAVRAPFEEEITFGQLTKLSARALLAKRSMTAEKIAAMSEAVKAALKTSHAPNQGQQSSPLLSTSMESAELAFTKRLLVAAMNELTDAQKARVLSGVATSEYSLQKVRKTKTKAAKVMRKRSVKNPKHSKKKTTKNKKSSQPKSGLRRASGSRK